VAARAAEVNAYPNDPDISWKALREELTKFVSSFPATQPDSGVLPFSSPDHKGRRPGWYGSRLHGVDNGGD
jgi:hypothetical protein